MTLTHCLVSDLPPGKDAAAKREPDRAKHLKVGGCQYAGLGLSHPPTTDVECSLREL
jgi:hypothetical protein